MTVNFTYLTFFLDTIFISAASIEARLAPVSIFAMTLTMFKSGRAAFSFQPTTLLALFFATT